MIIYAFYNAAVMADKNGLDKGQMALSMLYFGIATLFLQAIFMLILYIILKRKYEDAKYRLLTCGSVLGNVGFFGLPHVCALVPGNPIVACYSSIYIITMNLLVFTVGVFSLTNDTKYMNLKTALVNPTTFGFLLAIPAFIFGEKIAAASVVNTFAEGINLLGQMTTSLCMVILGIRLATVNFKSFWTRPFIYLICFLKMVVFPIACFFMVYFLPFLDQDFKKAILIISAVPCASVILNMAEIHHAEEELAANCVLVSTMLCMITIPIVTLLVNIL
jgi:predicted permease